MKTISILGSTGSVGRSTVDLIKSMPQTYSVDSLTANKNGNNDNLITSDITLLIKFRNQLRHILMGSRL